MLSGKPNDEYLATHLFAVSNAMDPTLERVARSPVAVKSVFKYKPSWFVTKMFCVS